MQNLLMVGITLIIVMGIALLFSILVKITPEESWAASVMSILLLVYVCGLFGSTIPAILILYIAGIVGILLSVGVGIRNRRWVIKDFVTPGIAMIFMIAAVGLVCFHDMVICNWDELYQWGKAADYMVQFDKLPTGADFTGESVLLSSTTFFHYFIARLSAFVMGAATESNYYVSNLILWFSALLLPFSGTGWKDWKRVWGFGLFQFLLTALIFVQPYYNIYTDQATCYWSGAVIAWILMRKYNKRNVFLVPLILMNVGMMKSMVGPMFAVIVLLVVLILYITNCKEKGISLLPKGWKKKLFSGKVLAGILAVLSPIILMLVWSVMTGENGIFRFNGGVSKQQVMERLVLTVKAMLQKALGAVNLQSDGLYLSYLLFLLLTVGIMWILHPMVLEQEEQRRYRTVMKTYVLGFAGYFLVMLFAYMTVFAYADSVGAISVNRYYSDYMMLGVIPLTVPFFLKNDREKKEKGTRQIKRGFLILSLLCIMYGTSDYILPNLMHIYAVDNARYEERENFVRYAEEVNEYTNGNGKVFFINQKESDLYTLAADYELGNQFVRTGSCFRFREEPDVAVSGLVEFPIYTLPQVLLEQGYNYVWVYSSNTYLKENMKELFDIKVKSKTLYRVVPKENGAGLEYVKRIK